MKKRILSICMALVMCLSLLPTAALADESTDAGSNVAELSHTASGTTTTTGYTTFNDAYAAAVKGDTIKLLKDAVYATTDENTTILTLTCQIETPLTIDLDGHTLRATFNGKDTGISFGSNEMVSKKVYTLKNGTVDCSVSIGGTNNPKLVLDGTDELKIKQVVLWIAALEVTGDNVTVGELTLNATSSDVKAKCNLKTGTFGKITGHTGDNMGDLLAEGYAYQYTDGADSGKLVALNGQTELSNVKVVPCTDHSYNKTKADGRCEYCGHECDHDWSNTDGICTICGKQCTHGGITSGTCTTCGYTLPAADNVAEVSHTEDGATTTTGYETFYDAYTAAKDGDTIKLLADMESVATSSSADCHNIKKAITLDLNGKSFKYVNSVMSIWTEVTITDNSDGTKGTIGSTITVDKNDVLQQDGKLTLDGGVTLGSVILYGGTLTVNNAKISENENEKLWVRDTGSTLTMKDGNVGFLNVDEGTTVTLSGGTFDRIERSANPTAPTYGGMLASGKAYQYTTGDESFVKLSDINGSTYGTPLKNVKVVECTDSDHSYDSTTGKCEYCGNQCAHSTWNAETGKCSVCGYSCDHTGYTDAETCGTCGATIKVTNYDVWVCGTQVTSKNKNDVLAGTTNAGKVSYTPATATEPQKLTLNGAKLTYAGDATHNAAIEAHDSLTVVVSEASFITLNPRKTDGYTQCGIKVERPKDDTDTTDRTLTITGIGGMGITFEKDTDNKRDCAYGLYAGDAATTTTPVVSGNVTITEHGIINVASGNATRFSYGIYARNGDVTIGGVDEIAGFCVSANGGEVTSRTNVSAFSRGIVAMRFNKGGNVTITGGGVYAYGQKATSETNNANSNGIYATNISISGTNTVTAAGGTATAGNGKATTGGIYVNGGKLTISNTTEAEIAIETTASGTVELSGGSYDALSTLNDTTLAKYLATGKAFAKISNSGIVDGYKTGLSSVKIVDHASHDWSSENGVCACGYKCDHKTSTDPDKCSVCGKQIYVAQINGDKKYETFSDAYEAAVSGDGIKLLADVKHTEFNKNITLTIDLNGKKLKAADDTGNNVYIEKGEYILKNGTVDDCDVNVSNGAALELRDDFKLVGEDRQLVLASGTKLKVTGDNVEVSGLWVSGLSDAVDCKLEKGKFGKIIADATNPLSSLLAEGYAFKTTNGDEVKWYDKYTNDNTAKVTIYNVEVMKQWITGVTLTADRDSYTFGDTVKLTADVKRKANDDAGISYDWYKDNDTTPFAHTFYDTNHTENKTPNLCDYSQLSAGTHKIYVKVTTHGYTRTSAPITVTVNKATLTEGTGYTAPTANTLTYNGGAQELVSAGTALTGCTVQYKLGESGTWSDSVPKAANAGTYNVYWYIDGGTNYQSIGSAEAPNGPIEVTIGKKDVVVTPNDGQSKKYGTADPTLTYTTDLTGDIAEKLDEQQSVSLIRETGEDVGQYKITLGTLNGGNFNVKPSETPVYFTITKADAPKLTDYTVSQCYSNENDQRITIDLTKHGFPTGATATSTSVEPDDFTKLDGVNIGITSAMCVGTTLNVNYWISNATSANIDDTVTFPITIKTKNYENMTLNVVVTLVEKETKSLTVTMEGWTYGETEKTPSYTENSGMIGTATVEYKRKNAEDSTYTTTVPTNAGEYTVRVSYETATEAYIGTENFTIARKDIKDAKIDLNYVTDTEKVYDGKQKTRTVERVTVDGKTLTAHTDKEATQCDYKVSSQTTGTNAGDYTITITGEGNYTGTATTTWTITQKPISANVSVAEKEYDGNTNAAVTVRFDLNDNQPVAGDSIEVTGVTGTFDNKNVGTGKTVTIDSSNATISGSGSKNYKVTFPSGITNGVIKAKPVTATVAAPEKVYDGSTGVALTATVTDGLIAGDSITITGLTGTFDTADVGTDKAVTVNSETAAVTGTGAGNYTLTYPAVTGAITPATPTGEPKYTAITTYGKTLADANLTAVGGTFSVSGTVKWVDADGNELAGTTAVTANTSYSWKFTPDSGNYSTIGGTVTLWHKSESSGGSSSSGSTVTVPISSDHATVEVKANVSKGNATVEVSDKQIDKVIADHAGDVTIDVSGLKNVESVTVPSRVVEKTNEAEDTGLTVALPTGSVTLDETALDAVSKGKDVTISVKTVSESELTTAQKTAIGEQASVAVVVDVSIVMGTVKQSGFNGGKLTISIPYTPKAGEDTSKLTVWFIRDDGTIENKGGRYDAKNKCFVFETDHLSQYILVNTGETKTFTDVPADAYFAGAVTWAAANGITGGTTDTTFSPYNSCTRAQIVTFLWRAAGSPEPTTQSSFSDVSAGAYYAKAVAWAVENGITNGFADGSFGVNTPCTRAQAVAFLFRYAAANGMDAVTLQELVSSYGDAASVPGYAVSAFNWALAQGIVTGNNGNLMPNNDCTRAQIVTFLYRLLGTN